MLRCLLSLFFLCVTGPAMAAESYARVDVVPGVTTAAPGQPFTIYIDQKITAGWHTYWKNPGDSGVATTVTWDAPAGTVTTDLAYPIPARIPFGPLMNFGFSDRAVFTTQMTIPADFAGDHFTATAQIDWLVCNDICIPESGTYRIDIGVGKTTTPNPTAQPLADIVTQTHPKEADWLVHYWEDKDLSIDLLPMKDSESLALAQAKSVELFPVEWGLVQNAGTSHLGGTDDGTQRFFLGIPRGDRPLADVPTTEMLVVVTDHNDIRTGYRVTAKHVADAAQASEQARAFYTNHIGPLGLDMAGDSAPIRTLWGVLALAFLAGLILNLMPCVLPVLFIKVLSLAKLSGFERRHAQFYGISYTAGVVLTFVTLGLALMLAQGTVVSAGWGFQLQSPVFVGVLIVVFVVLSINLLGGFEVNLLGFIPARLHTAAQNNISGSFFAGVLAVLVATPCTVPFMGAAVAYALTSTPLVTLGVFTSMGIGMAAPFAVLTFIPSAMGWLPKPGAWMITLRRICAVPMILTACWLFSVFLQQVTPVARTLPDTGGYQSIPYTPATLDTALASGQPVFVNMTAAWCITCKVNEHLALDRPETITLFTDHHVQYVVGDWTKGDSAITTYLDGFGRKGVPLYVYYPAGDPRPDPVVLPQLLSPAGLRAVLSK